MKNSRGFSWPETIVALSITLLVALTLLPILSNMTVQLEEKKRKYYSTVVMLEGVKRYTAENTLAGTMHMDNLQYTFIIDNYQICVRYEGMRGEKSNCVALSY